MLVSKIKEEDLTFEMIDRLLFQGLEDSGKNADCIDDNVCTALVLAGNHLYYQHFDTKKYTTLYKSDLAGKHMSEVEKAIINPHAVSQGKIYFNGTSGDHYLYALNLNDDKISTVWPGNVWNPVVLGNFVYYMDLSNHYGLSRYSLVIAFIALISFASSAKGFFVGQNFS